MFFRISGRRIVPGTNDLIGKMNYTLSKYECFLDLDENHLYNEIVIILISTLAGDTMTIQDTSESRKKLSHIYNEIAKELFGFGTTLLRVAIENNIITFYAKHRRSPRSAALEGEAPALKLEVDFRMSLLYKKRLRERLEEEMGLRLEAVLRDYDAATQWAITNIILAEDK